MERQLSKVQFSRERSECAQSRAQASVDALDVTIARAYARREPTVGGVVEAWAGKYGKRGGLGESIAQLLREAAPAPLPTSVKGELAACHFGITSSGVRACQCPCAAVAEGTGAEDYSATLTGVGWLAKDASLPSWPALSRPQHLSAPAVVTAQVWYCPAETLTTPEVSPNTSTGVYE